MKGKFDVAPTITYYANLLTNTRDESMKEAIEVTPKARSKCYTVSVQIAGIVKKALIDSEAEITCISEEFLKNKERFEKCPSLPLSRVAVASPIAGKAVRLNRQIYADVQLLIILIQLAFLVVPRLARTCIIGIDALDEHETRIYLDTRMLIFLHLDRKPAIRILQDESNENLEGQYNLTNIESVTDETEKWTILVRI